MWPFKYKILLWMGAAFVVTLIISGVAEYLHLESTVYYAGNALIFLGVVFIMTLIGIAIAADSGMFDD